MKKFYFLIGAVVIIIAAVFTYEIIFPREETLTPTGQGVAQTSTANSASGLTGLPEVLSEATSTTDWKTYVDPTYGFSFNYPQALTLQVVPSSSDQFQESVEEIALNSSDPDLSSIIYIHVATSRSIALEKQESAQNTQYGGESISFTPFACEKNLTVSCSLYLWPFQGNPEKIFVADTKNQAGEAIRVEFDAGLLELGSNSFDTALGKYVDNSNDTMSISDSQLMNLAQTTGEPENIGIVDILNGIQSSFRMN